LGASRCVLLLSFFFFSSRRRHTRSLRDWSSDVCSSDLGPSVLLTLLLPATDTGYTMARYSAFLGRRVEVQYRAGDILLPASGTRSEERRVGKEGRSHAAREHENKGVAKPGRRRLSVNTT